VTYGRIETTADLPVEGAVDLRSRERRDLDFKKFADPAQMCEHAKDEAAFANALGGVLVIGADIESDPTKLAYPGIRGQTAADVIKLYEQAATMCSPVLSVDVLTVKAPSGLDLVIINVDPFAGQVVGCPAPSNGKKGTVADAWKFPMRRGSHTIFIAPEDLPMYMSQHVRRAYLLLASIPAPQRSQVRVLSRFFRDNLYRADRNPQEELLDLEVHGPDRNFITLRRGNRSGRIPLSYVVEVWAENENTYAIAVDGRVTVGEEGISFRPLL
jgi:hypothetical protein